MATKKCKCGVEIEDKYIMCYDCIQKAKGLQETTPPATNPDTLNGMNWNFGKIANAMMNIDRTLEEIKDVLIQLNERE